MEEQKTTSFFRFEDLRVYDKALDYYKWLLEQVKTADEFSQRTLLYNFLDSALCICTEIAEGSSKPKTEFPIYLNSAKTFVRKCVVFTTTAEQNGIFTSSQAEISRNTLIEMIKMLGAMIASLQRNRRKRQDDIMTESDYNTSSNNSSEFLNDLNSSELNLDNY